MGIADVPTSFGLPFFIKTFLPGLVASILYSCAVMPIIDSSFWASLTVESKLILWIISVIVIGMVITSLDLYIYQFFEGIRFWLGKIWWWKYKRIQRHFENIDNELKNLKNRNKAIMGKKELKKEDKKELLEINYEISKIGAEIRKFPDNPKIDYKLKNLGTRKEEIMGKKKLREEDKKKLLNVNHKRLKLWDEVRKFPYNPDEGFYSERYPEDATIFGNVLREYEGYSKKQYGMSLMVFWPHLWLILPKEVKKDLDLRGAEADFLVYLSFIFLSYTLIGGVGFYFQQNTWVSILTCDIPIRAIICFFLSIVLCFFFYRISIQAHVSYGRYVKAVFDLYRVDLAKKLKTDIVVTNLIPNDAERKSWRKYWEYLLDYKKPDKK